MSLRVWSFFVRKPLNHRFSQRLYLFARIFYAHITCSLPVRSRRKKFLIPSRISCVACSSSGLCGPCRPLAVLIRTPTWLLARRFPTLWYMSWVTIATKPKNAKSSDEETWYRYFLKIGRSDVPWASKLLVEAMRLRLIYQSYNQGTETEHLLELLAIPCLFWSSNAADTNNRLVNCFVKVSSRLCGDERQDVYWTLYWNTRIWQSWHSFSYARSQSVRSTRGWFSYILFLFETWVSFFFGQSVSDFSPAMIWKNSPSHPFS